MRNPQVAGVEAKLESIVGPQHAWPAGPADAVAGLSPRVIVEPASEQQVAAVLRCADDAGWAVIPRGGGTKLDWGNPPSRADLVLSTARLNQILEHAWADLTVTVQAGCRVSVLQQALAQHRQRLAIDALWPEQATVGGILSSNDSGPLRLRYGGLRDLVIGVTLALADGTLAASGGKVVKNVAGYDLPKLATGALGTLGVITRATFRLHPVPQMTRSLSIRGESANQAQELLLAVVDSRSAPAGMQLRLRANDPPVVDLLLEGSQAGLASLEGSIRALAGTAAVADAAHDVWAARQELWSSPNGAIAKLSILPSDIAETISTIASVAAPGQPSWTGVVQATGIGWLRLDGNVEQLPGMLREVRAEIERRNGSFVILRQPRGATRLDAWGNPGDALPLMRALKQQLDPRGSLNPGRFVGGI